MKKFPLIEKLNAVSVPPAAVATVLILVIALVGAIYVWQTGLNYGGLSNAKKIEYATQSIEWQERLSLAKQGLSRAQQDEKLGQMWREGHFKLPSGSLGRDWDYGHSGVVLLKDGKESKVVAPPISVPWTIVNGKAQIAPEYKTLLVPQH